METGYDYIAMPKGQMPGGPVQASSGEWYLVIPLTFEMDRAIEWMIAIRRGHPVTDQEIAKAAEALSQKAADKIDDVRSAG